MRCHWDYPPKVDCPVAKVLSWPILLWAMVRVRNYDIFRYEGAGELLDYGCGNGKYLLRMRDRGWKVTGMDMSAEAIDVCQQRELRAFVGVAPDRQFDAGSFDVVTLWHVLEHVPSPTETLEQVNRILKPNGKLVFGVPNINSLPARWFGKYWFGLDLPRHVTQFSKITAAKLVEKTGFRVEKIFAQRYGQTVQGSFSYLARDKPSKLVSLPAKSKRLCYAIQCLTLLRREPAEIVVHARKV